MLTSPTPYSLLPFLKLMGYFCKPELGFSWGVFCIPDDQLTSHWFISIGRRAARAGDVNCGR